MRERASRSAGDMREKISGTSNEKSWSIRIVGPMVPAEDSQPS